MEQLNKKKAPPPSICIWFKLVLEAIARYLSVKNGALVIGKSINNVFGYSYEIRNELGPVCRCECTSVQSEHEIENDLINYIQNVL